MRVKSVTERYRAVNEGTMSKKEFVRQMRQQYPMHITQFNGFDDSVQILKNRGLLFETKKEVVEAHVYDERPALNYSLDALDRAIRIEIQTLGLEPGENISAEDFKKAEKKAKANLEKNPTHYLDLMSGESKKVDKHDKMKETKRGAKDADTFNALKKATLKEGYTEEQIEAAIQRIKERKTSEEEYEEKPGMFIDDEEWEREMGRGPKEDTVKEADKTALIQTMNNAIAAIKGKYGEMPGIAGIIRDFLMTHLDDLADGADPLDEFENYVDANYDSLSEEGEVNELSSDAIEALTGIIGAGGVVGAGVALNKLMDTLEAGKLGDRGKAVAKFLRDAGTTFSGAGLKEGEVEVNERVGGKDDIIELIKTRAMDATGDEQAEVIEVTEFMARHYFGNDIEEFLEQFTQEVGIDIEFGRQNMEEKKGKDHDGDGDIDGDDYMAAKDKAIKKAMGKDEQLKEAVKTLIRKALTEETINEAATGNLSKFSDDYADFEGMTQIINQLENLVTDVEGYYAKTSEKLQKIFDSIGNVTNEEGLKVGGFIAPAIEAAFRKDVQPVVKKGFMNAVQIPTIKTISSAEIERMKADQGMAEEEMEEKQTMFTPVMESKKK